MSKYLREFYHSVRMITSISSTKSTVSASFASFIFEFVFDILSWSSLLCTCLSANDSRTQNFRTLYHEHTNSSLISVSRCSWFTQAKKTQESYHLRKHELKIKNKLKEKMKQLTKQKKKIRLAKKRAKRYTCKRCKHSIKFDNNIKLHEHIRTRHAKKSKSKSVQQSIVSLFAQTSESKFASKQSMFSSSVSSSRSIIFSSLTSSKLLFFSMSTSEIVRERSESVSSTSSEFSSEFLSVATSRKPISWTEIVSRFVASKFSRLPIATLKLMCKSLKNANIVCSSTSSRTSTSSRFYLTVNDLFRMFVEKSSSFDLQSNQKKSLSSRDSDKCNFANKCDLIQSRITSYFHAMISSAFKSIKFEAFSATHVSMKQSTRISSLRIFRFSSSMRLFLSTFFRSSSVCRHCQERFVIYWSTGWVTSNVSRFENNEILMRQRYWSFAPSRSTLKKYWSLLEEVTTLKKLKHVVCLLFVRSLSLLIVDRFEEVKSCCMLCLFVYCFTNL